VNPLDRFCKEKATSENCDEKLFCEDYARTISSENYIHREPYGAMGAIGCNR
jgi:hypothetical protein